MCGSFAAEQSLGKSPDKILNITGEAILEKLGGLPEEDKHCAFLSVDALQEALNDYMIKQQKKPNRKIPLRKIRNNENISTGIKSLSGTIRALS